MLDAGEPALYIARRVVRMAVEDIGLADRRRCDRERGKRGIRLFGIA
jgi:replication-associated recombination protein RarA